MQTINFLGRIRPESPYWMSVLLVVASLALSGGCDGGGVGEAVDTDASTVSVTDSSGVPIVSNRGSGWAPEAAWRLEPDLQVGEIDGPLAFGRINWVTPGPDNGLLVLDGQSHLVHVFDSEGRPIRSFGGEGDGPGEFRRPASITALADGRVAVGEGFPPVLHWLTAAGEYLSSTRLPIARDEAGTRTAGSFGVWQVTTSGQVFVQVQVIDPGADDGQMPVVLADDRSRGSEFAGHRSSLDLECRVRRPDDSRVRSGPHVDATVGRRRRALARGPVRDRVA